MPPTTRTLVAGPCKKATTVAAVLVLVSGCGDAGDAGSAGSAAAVTTAPGVGEVTTAEDGVQEITLQTQDDYVFTPSSFTVEPGRVRLTVTNVAEEMVHNFRFTPDAGPAEIDSSIDLLSAGEESTIEFEVTEPGDYPFECSFHVQLDQVGTMTVSG